MDPVLGYFFLLVIFAGMFYLIFKVGSPLETWLLQPWETIKSTIENQFGHSLLAELLIGLVQGIGGGIAIVFPYFIPLLFLMGFLEDAGYLPGPVFFWTLLCTGLAFTASRSRCLFLASAAMCQRSWLPGFWSHAGTGL